MAGSVNLNIQAKIATTSGQLQSQLDGLIAKLNKQINLDLNIDSKTLNVLNEFAQSFKQLNSLIVDQQKSIDGVQKSLQSMGQSGSQWAKDQIEAIRQASQEMDKFTEKRKNNEVYQTIAERTLGNGQKHIQQIDINTEDVFDTFTIDGKAQDAAKSAVNKFKEQMRTDLKSLSDSGLVEQPIVDGLMKATEAVDANSEEWKTQLKGVQTEYNDIVKQVQSLTKLSENLGVQVGDAFNSFNNTSELQKLQTELDSIQIDKNGQWEEKVKSLQAIFDGLKTQMAEIAQLQKEALSFNGAQDSVMSRAGGSQFSNTIFEKEAQGLSQLARSITPDMANWQEQFVEINNRLTEMLGQLKQVDQAEKQAYSDAEKYQQQKSQILSRLQDLQQNPYADQQAVQDFQDQLTGKNGAESILNPATSSTQVSMINDALKTLEVEAKQAEDEYTSSVSAMQSKWMTFMNAGITTARDTFNQLEQIYLQNLDYFKNNINERMSMLSALAAAEKKAAAEGTAGGGGRGGMSDNYRFKGYAFTPMDITKSMIGFQAFNVASDFTSQFVQIQQSAAQLQGVLGSDAQTQQQLNQVAGQFIGIAQQYGSSITEVMNAGTLWGRQYKNLNEVLALTNESTQLSVVDNLSVADANKAVESSMNAMQLSTGGANQAIASATQLVDSWSNVSHQASVSAGDLTGGFERSAAAAHEAGLNINELNALVAAGVRNTGRSGNIIGNMWKSVLANLDSGTPKVQAAVQALGVKYDPNNMYEMILNISKAAQKSTPDMAKYFETIAGGKYQYDSLMAAIGNTTTIQDAYTASATSAGTAQMLAQVQTQTLGAEINKLKDNLQGLAYAGSTNGLTSVFKDLVTGITDVVVGLENMPKAVLFLAGVVPAVLLITKALNGVKNAGADAVNFFVNSKRELQNTFTWMSNLFTGNKTPTQSSRTSQLAAMGESTTQTSGNTAALQANSEAMIANTEATGENTAAKSANAEANAADSAALTANSTEEATNAITSETSALEANAAKASTAASEAENLAGNATKVGVSAVGAEEGLAAMGVATDGIGFILAGVVAVATVAIGVFGSLSQKAKEMNAQIKQNQQSETASYQQNGQAIDALVTKYSQLSQATNNGQTFKDSAQMKEYYQVSTELGGYLPTLVNYIDANGQAHLENASDVNKEVAAIKGLVAANQDAGSSLQAVDKDYANAQKSIAGYQSAMDNIGKIQKLPAGTDPLTTLGYDMTEWLFSQSSSLTQAQRQADKQQLAQLKEDQQQYIKQIQSGATQMASAYAQQKNVIMNSGNTNTLNSLAGAINWDKIGGNKSMQDQAARNMADVMEAIAKAEKDGTSYTNAYEQALAALGQNGIPLVNGGLDGMAQKLADTNDGIANQSTLFSTASTNIDNVIAKNKDLYSAMDEINKNGKLDQTTIDSLSSTYGKPFVDAVSKGTVAVENFLNATVASNNGIIKSDSDATQALLDNAKKRLSALQDEAQAEEKLMEVAEANGAVNMITNQAFSKYQDIQSLISKVKGEISSYESVINQYTDSMPDLSSGQDLTSTTTSNTAANDKYEQAIENVTLAITAQEDALNNMDQASSAYREGLQKEIGLLQQKEGLLKSDINYLGGSSSAYTNTTTGGTGVGSYSGQYSSYINAAANKYNVPAQLIAAVIQQESGFNAGEVSGSGAVGLMQLMPSTARSLGVSNPYNAEDNIMGGTKYLSEQLQKFGGNIEDALAAYNAGPGAVEKYGGIPPYSQTQSYVKSIMAMYNGSGAIGEPTLKDGSSGSAVKSLQEDLKKAGYSIATDGIFGSQTQKVVEEFQKSAKLGVDGIVGNQTWTALLNKIGVKTSGGGSGTSTSATNSDQQALEQVLQQIQADYDKIAESYIASYANKQTNLSDEATRYGNLADSYAVGPSQRSAALSSEVSAQNAYIANLKEEMTYIQQETEASNISAAEKVKLADDYTKLDDALQKANIDLAQMQYTQVTDQITNNDNAIKDLDKSLQSYSKTMSDFPNDSAEYAQAMAGSLSTMQQEGEAIASQIDYINSQIQNPNLTGAEQQQLQQQGQQYVQQYQSLQDQLLSIKKSTAQQIIQAEKDALNQQMTSMDQAYQDQVQQLQDEKTAYDGLIDLQTKVISNNRQMQQYNEKLTTDQTSLQKLQNQYNALAGDNSSFGMGQKQSLAEQIQQMQQSIADEQAQQSDTLQTNALNDQKTAYDNANALQQKQLQEQYTVAKQQIQDLVNNTTYWDNQLTQMLNGNFSTAESQLSSLLSTIQGNSTSTSETFNQMATQMQTDMGATGTSIQTNIINELQTAVSLMNTLQNSGVNLGANLNVANPSGGANIGGGNSGSVPSLPSSGGSSSSSGSSSSGSKSSGSSSSAPKAPFTPSHEPLLQDGSTGSAVKTLQEALNHAGYKLAVDGIFGVDTMKAVEAFQRASKINVDGIAGINTWTKLADKYDTGGYTGSLPDTGSLAVLHSKELVLNADDTRNILNAVKMIRQSGLSELLSSSANIVPQAIKALSNITSPNIGSNNSNQSTTVTIHMPVNIASLTGDEAGATKLFDSISSQLKRKGVVLK